MGTLPVSFFDLWRLTIRDLLWWRWTPLIPACPTIRWSCILLHLLYLGIIHSKRDYRTGLFFEAETVKLGDRKIPAVTIMEFFCLTPQPPQASRSMKAAFRRHVILSYAASDYPILKLLLMLKRAQYWKRRTSGSSLCFPLACCLSPSLQKEILGKECSWLQPLE